MFELRRSDGNGNLISLHKATSYRETYNFLKDSSFKKSGDIFLLFQVKKDHERVIQIFQIKKSGFIQHLMPQDWWWPPRMRERIETEAREEYEQRYVWKNRNYRNENKNEDFHTDG